MRLNCNFKSLLFALLLFPSLLYAQQKKTLSVEERIHSLSKKIDSIYNYHEFEDYQQIITIKLDSLYQLLSSNYSRNVNIQQLNAELSSGNIMYTPDRKVRFFVWSNSNQDVFESSAVVFTSVWNDTILLSTTLTDSEILPSRVFQLDDNHYLIESYGRSARNCYYSYYDVASIQSDTFKIQESVATFSYSLPSKDEFISYDDNKKRISYANRPCYSWDSPLTKGKLTYQDGQFILTEGERP